ncbi:MAG: MOSC N-terminal beta barrel domain-containing protein [Pseudomonadales bacterium]|nr:MOSC N-terminal beta barrel domain-containing protein [Pseudomonadales bacterium]
MSDSCVVSALYSYPVKSCQGASVPAAELSPFGLEGDRQLLILNDGKFTNQARLPKLATVGTRRIAPDCIEFTAGGRSLTHTVTSDGAASTIEFYGNAVRVLDQGDALAELLSDSIGKPLRVVSLESTFQRAIPLEEFALVDGTTQSRFVDVAPILVTSVASLADLNTRLEEPVPMNRFRPNVVIEGLDAYEEDAVVALEGDGWALARATHCERCATTCTDQETGVRTSEPLATLKSYRHRENGYAGGVLFGAYMAVNGEGTIRVGDRLRVVRPDS